MESCRPFAGAIREERYRVWDRLQLSRYGSRTLDAVSTTESRRQRSPVLLPARCRTSGTDDEGGTARVGTPMLSATHRGSIADIDGLMSTRGEVLVGHEQMLILIGRVGRDRAEAKVVEALDQGALVLLLLRCRCRAGVSRRGADWAKVTAASALSAGSACTRAVHAAAGAGGARSVHAAAVKLMAGERGRVEIGRLEFGTGIEIGRQIAAVVRRVEDVAMRELRVIRRRRRRCCGRAVLEEVRTRVRVLLRGTRRGDYATGR